MRRPTHESADPLIALYPPDLTKVECCLCHDAVESIASHLEQRHRTVRLDEYMAMFASAPIEGVTSPSATPKTVHVTSAEADAHPGGRDAVLIEKALDPLERGAFRADVAALITEGHRPSHQVASIAYLQTLSRRTRLRIEFARDTTDGEVFHSEALEMFHNLEAKIGKGIADLEKIRAQRVAESGEEDPRAVVDHELAAAEAWVQSTIGEFVAACPGCGQMLTAPALPHWAYTPLQTDRGLSWPVWSPEMWRLVLAGEMTLATMAYCLRTSPEGLQYTAVQRGTPWPEWLDLVAAEAELRVRLVADDRLFDRGVAGEMKALPARALETVEAHE